MKFAEQDLFRILDKKRCQILIRKAGKYRFTASYQYETHQHAEYEVNYVDSGNCVMTFEGEYVPVKMGECIVIPPFSKHGFLVDAKSGCRITQTEFRVWFGDGKKDEVFAEEKVKKYFRISECEDIVYLMEQIARIHRMEERGEYKEIQETLAIAQLLSALDYHLGKSGNEKYGIGNRKIVAIMRHLQEHYSEPVEIEKIARQEGVSSRYVRRYFAEKVGMSCQDYITVLRINKAKKLLRETEKSVTQIGLEVGYGTPQYFSRVFKEQVGMTPSAYRSE